ncbi:MAG: L-serine ammonia-lyase [Cellvibrionaceae bacterium]|nr:L-serine ammonia-lyase [Cellvibrionaceae bacterium]|tara:strand:- start:7727 stop:9190 length:1464 start_codon:yes stop_codon:yes gene_type:complete
MVVSVFDLFSIGIGPSSSHTVGPMRAANTFVQCLREQRVLNQTARLQVTIYGSLAATGVGHGTHRAVILGLMEKQPELIDPDDIPTFMDQLESTRALSFANGPTIEFSSSDIVSDLQVLDFHPNGLRFLAYSDNGKTLLEKIYFSVGGGFVVDASTTNKALTDNETQPVSETPEASESASSIVEKCSSDRHSVNVSNAFSSAQALLEICHNRDITIAHLMRLREQKNASTQQVCTQLQSIWRAMQDCVERGLRHRGVLPGRLQVKRRAPKLYEELKQQADDAPVDPLQVMDWVNLYALAVSEENAGGGRVVTAPTNGAAGIIPAVLHYYRDFVDSYSEEGVEDFLLTAAAIGSLYKMNASISGAEVGCQGEVGSASSMAAGGLTAVLGGSLEQIEYAAEIAMEHNLGLTCDPIEGLVQVPCIERNAIAAVKAINASRMALKSDGQHCVSLDEVIKTMRETGRDMSQKYKETATGGLAVEVPVRIIEC